MGLETGVDLDALLEVRRMLDRWLPGEAIFGFTSEAGLPLGFEPVSRAA